MIGGKVLEGNILKETAKSAAILLAITVGGAYVGSQGMGFSLGLYKAKNLDMKNRKKLLLNIILNSVQSEMPLLLDTERDWTLMCF